MLWDKKGSEKDDDKTFKKYYEIKKSKVITPSEGDNKGLPFFPILAEKGAWVRVQGP